MIVTTNKGNLKEDQPIFANYQTIRKHYGLSRDFLLKLFAEGKIRSVKLTPAKSSQRLFRVEDIEKFLLEKEEFGKELAK